MEEDSVTTNLTASRVAFKDSQNDSVEANENSPLISNSNGEDIDENGGHFSFTKLPSRSKYTLLLCCVANFFVGCSYAILAPFFPQEAAKKGVSTTVVGFIFSLFELVIFISSPIYGNYIRKIGSKFLLTAGILVGGCCSILFGVLDKCPPGFTFAAMCFATRSLEGLAFSAFVTAGFAILSNEFPNSIATVIGLQETANGIGMMVGPAVGGALYELAGYGAPFFVMGGLIILNGLVLACFLPPPSESPQRRRVSMFKLFTSPIVLLSMMSIMMCSLGISFLDPTLAKHLEPFHLSTAVVGLMFVIGPGMYAITTPFWGYLVDNKNLQGSLMVGGHLVYAIAFLLFGPSPLLPFLPFKLWLLIVAGCFMGVGVGCAFVPNMKCLISGAMDVGFEDSIDTFGTVSGLFNSMFCLGAFTGPMLGGVLVQHYGFDVGSTVIGGLNVIVCLVALVFFTLRYLKRRRSSDSRQLESSETEIEAERVQFVGARDMDAGLGRRRSSLYKRSLSLVPTGV